MLKARWDIDIDIGEDWTLDFTIEIDDVLFLLDNTSVYCQFREQLDRNSRKIFDAVAKVDGVEIVNPAPTNHEVQLSLTNAQTAEVNDDDRAGWYDVLFVNPSGVEDKFYLYGRFQFHGTVTVKP